MAPAVEHWLSAKFVKIRVTDRCGVSLLMIIIFQSFYGKRRPGSLYTTICKKVNNNYQSVQNHLEIHLLRIFWNPIGRRMPILHKFKMAATFFREHTVLYMHFQQIKLHEAGVMHLFGVILTGESMFDIIMMIQSHYTGQKVNIKIKIQKCAFKKVQIATSVILYFDGFLPE